ncbi:hypothetical protein GGR61_000912 [Xanthomonas arboricola]|nr:hypothetical protein [Xanthomonas sp. 3058]
MRAMGARAESARWGGAELGEGTGLRDCQSNGCLPLASVRATARPGTGSSARSDILSDSPPRHIPVPLSANPRPRCRFGKSFP